MKDRNYVSLSRLSAAASLSLSQDDLLHLAQRIYAAMDIRYQDRLLAWADAEANAGHVPPRVGRVQKNALR